MAQSKADSFTAFLEAKQRNRKLQQVPYGGTPLSLLSVLADAPRQQLPVPDLQAASGMSFPDFAESLKALIDSGYLNLSGLPGSEVATLTALGEDLMNVVGPDVLTALTAAAVAQSGTRLLS